MCFVWISEQTAIISLYDINWLGFITETECVYCTVRTGSLLITHVSPWQYHSTNAPYSIKSTYRSNVKRKSAKPWNLPKIHAVSEIVDHCIEETSNLFFKGVIIFGCSSTGWIQMAKRRVRRPCAAVHPASTVVKMEPATMCVTLSGVLEGALSGDCCAPITMTVSCSIRTA